MNIKFIEYRTPEYDQMIELRNGILREPFGLVFTNEDLLQDEYNRLVGCFSGNRIVGCCVLSVINENTVQLRQMAVAVDFQRMGIGSGILRFVECFALENSFRFIYLHARKVAVNFYTKHGYMLESNEFMEVGMPHFEMLKSLEF